jgi:apolipoprotein N-acyltransferase
LRRLKLSLPQLRQILVVGVGLLWAAAFPTINLAGCAWIAPGLLLFLAKGETGEATFRLGYLGGLAHFLASLYWLLYNPFPAGAAAGWLLLSAYLALYPALWVWFCWKCFPGLGNPTGARWGQRAIGAMACAALWVAGELIRGRFLTGFPWNFLGVSQYRVLPLIQLASITGVYGISFLMVWFSVSLATTGVGLWHSQKTRAGGGDSLPFPAGFTTRPQSAVGRPWSFWLGEMMLPFLVLASVIGWGVHQLTHPGPAGPVLNTVLIQPSIPQTLIWDPKESDYRFQKLMQLSEEALRTKPDLLVWPEAAVPNLLRYDTNVLRAVTNLVRRHHVWMIVGADDAEPRADTHNPEAADYFNASFLISPDGQLEERYCKRRLVIFGEYVPLQPWLPLLKWFTPVGDGFQPGRRPVPFVMPRAKTSVLICFEDIFPHAVREYVETDTDFLLNLTNNGWFGESAAQWQHAANAALRAVENRLPLVRCANNGLTCWVDAWGRLQDVYFPGSTDIYRAGFKTAAIPLLPPGTKRAATFYRVHGDWLGWGCVTFAALLVLRQVRGAVNSRGQEKK